MSRESRNPPRRPLTRDEVARVAAAFAGEFAARNRALWVVGVTTGYRVMELLSLRVFDVWDGERFRHAVRVEPRHMKGGRRSRSCPLPVDAHHALRVWLDDMAARGWTADDEWLFRSRNGGPLNRIEAWRAIKLACATAGVSGATGTHSCRKSFSLAVYTAACQRLAAGEAIDPFLFVSVALGHRDPVSTRRYLSFLDGDVETTVRSLGLFAAKE